MDFLLNIFFLIFIGVREKISKSQLVRKYSGLKSVNFVNLGSIVICQLLLTLVQFQTFSFKQNILDQSLSFLDIQCDHRSSLYLLGPYILLHRVNDKSVIINSIEPFSPRQEDRERGRTSLGGFSLGAKYFYWWYNIINKQPLIKYIYA